MWSSPRVEGELMASPRAGSTVRSRPGGDRESGVQARWEGAGKGGSAHLSRAGWGGTSLGTHPAGSPPLGAARPLSVLEAGSERSLPTGTWGRPARSFPAPPTVDRALHYSAGGYGCSVPPTSCPSGASSWAGAAATAPVPTGSVSRFPAALGPPGTSLLPAGETPSRPGGAGVARLLWAGARMDG